MALLTNVVLDVLKPHQPGILELARALGEALSDCSIHIRVEEMDEKTESITLQVRGSDLRYDVITSVLSEYGASVHSIDEVDVLSEPRDDDARDDAEAADPARA